MDKETLKILRNEHKVIIKELEQFETEQFFIESLKQDRKERKIRRSLWEKDKSTYIIDTL